MPASARRAAPARTGRTWLVQAWKWGAGSLSAGAALISIISSVRSLPADHVRWIGVRPTADTARAIGDSIQLALTITDARGGVVPGVQVGWTSTDTTVAAVDSAGTVVARAPGVATVVAAAGGRIAQSRILVRPRAAAIWLQGDSVIHLGEGETTRLVARVVDERRHPVAGQPVTWRSSDSAVAVVDSTGRAVGVAAGRSTLVAAGGDLVLERPVEVLSVPATITLLAGDGQRASAGQRLAVPVRAQIVSRGGRPMAGVPVRFAAAEPAGRFAPEVDTSNADGIVQSVWILGDRPGRQRSALAVDGDPPIATALAADAEPDAANTRIIVPELPAGTAGAELPEPVAVRVTDSTGAPLSDLPVSWTAETGSIVADGVRTDSLGEARARWTLGPRAGGQRVAVQLGGLRTSPRGYLSTTALPGSAVALELVAAGVRRGVAGQLLSSPVMLRALDRSGNRVPDVRLTLRAGQGSALARTPVTDAAGSVTVDWRLGAAAGPQRMAASIPGLDRPVEILALARAGAPAKIVLEGVPETATARQPLAISALVTDGHGNAAAGVAVTFGSRAGKVAPARARSDSTGRARTRWVLDSRAGEQAIEVRVGSAGPGTTARVRVAADKKKAR